MECSQTIKVWSKKIRVARIALTYRNMLLIWCIEWYSSIYGQKTEEHHINCFFVSFIADRHVKWILDENVELKTAANLPIFWKQKLKVIVFRFSTCYRKNCFKKPSVNLMYLYELSLYYKKHEIVTLSRVTSTAEMWKFVCWSSRSSNATRVITDNLLLARKTKQCHAIHNI